jgi:hypothetical protein
MLSQSAATSGVILVDFFGWYHAACEACRETPCD